MIRKKLGEIEWLEFELLADFPKLAHGVFLRHGGVSKPSNYASLNALTRGDCVDHIQENRRRICQTLNIPPLAFAKHIHDSHIAFVDQAKEYVDFDGLMTSSFDVGLLMTHADCQAAIFYDPILHVCANVHAGWRGQMKNIYQNTVEKMQLTFGSKAENLLVCVSPSLGPDHAEFIHYEKEILQKYWKFQTKPTYFNLWEIARFQLEEAGILSHHIQIAQIDTFSNPQDFFSYRREKRAGNVTNVTGGHGTVVALKN